MFWIHKEKVLAKKIVARKNVEQKHVSSFIQGKKNPP